MEDSILESSYTSQARNPVMVTSNYGRSGSILQAKREEGEGHFLKADFIFTCRQALEHVAKLHANPAWDAIFTQVKQWVEDTLLRVQQYEGELVPYSYQLPELDIELPDVSRFKLDFPDVVKRR